MRDKIDFKRIIIDEKIIGVINFNLMIPVEEDQLKEKADFVKCHFLKPRLLR